MENWKPVTGYPEYLVSDAGNIKSIFSEGICLRPDTSAQGYKRVTLYRGKHRKRNWHRFQVHQIVMLTFIGPCPPKLEINHKNGVPEDNRVENLEYVTKKYNQWHCNNVIKTRTPQRGSKHGMHKLTEAKVIEIRAL